MMNKKNLISVLSVQTISRDERRMRKYIKNFVKKIDGAKLSYNANNIYVVKGSADIYPCVAAHMDTVHKMQDEFKVLETENNRLFAFDSSVMEQVGIGGDDKVGVFIALEALAAFDNIKVVFFSQEEIGCIGSASAKMKFFKDCSFVLQCDRNGYKDFINKGCGAELFGKEFNDEIAPFLATYGYKTAMGSLTDVVTLKRHGLDVACANIACGYYDPHSKSEWVDIDDVTNCWNLVYDLIDNLGNKKHPHAYVKPVFKHTTTTLHRPGVPVKYGGLNYQSNLPAKLNDAGSPFKPWTTPMGHCKKCWENVYTSSAGNGYCKNCMAFLADDKWIKNDDWDKYVDGLMDEKKALRLKEAEEFLDRVSDKVSDIAQEQKFVDGKLKLINAKKAI